MPRWLDSLFRRRREPASVSPPAAPPEAPAPAAENVAQERHAVGVAVEARERETCPNCGGTGVFAGPPGHRYCMRCALRSEQI
jgi:hypothetical protein